MVADESDGNESSEARKSPGRTWPDWHRGLVTFRNSSIWKAVWQLTNTLVPYGILWYLMIRSIHLGYSYAWTLLLAVPAAGFMVRIFIFFHDCVHGSFFASQRANAFFGNIFGVLVFTPFEDWRFSHLRHHATYANLDARGFGDIWTMTLQEYRNSPRKGRLLYRLYRSPVVLIGLGAFFIFLLSNRLPTRTAKRREWMSVLLTNLLVVAVFLVAARFIGWRTYLLIQLPVLWLAGVGGIWLFYVQHQFPGGYWASKTEWEPLRAAMEGSSFYKLPAVLRWFSGNIGYHHVHHLSPRIPNYRLKKCHDTVPELQAIAPLTLVKSLSCIRKKIWDEERQEMVSFP
jgi:acyl-lipid omega-6 desaturase (Delta-12 desaturase)